MPRIFIKWVAVRDFPPVNRLKLVAAHVNRSRNRAVCFVCQLKTFAAETADSTCGFFTAPEMF